VTPEDTLKFEKHCRKVQGKKGEFAGTRGKKDSNSKKTTNLLKTRSDARRGKANPEKKKMFAYPEQKWEKKKLEVSLAHRAGGGSVCKEVSRRIRKKGEAASRAGQRDGGMDSKRQSTTTKKEKGQQESS